MKILRIPGGTYGDALPTGEYACLVVTGDHAVVETHLRQLEIPGDHRPLYLRCTKPEDLGFRFAGQSSNSPQTIEWIDPSGWSAIDIVPCGVSPVIYDNFSTLTISDCSVGSQGYRFCDADNRLWTGDETIAAKPGSYVAEWTDIGHGITIGQCNLTPGIALYDGTNVRMIDPGDAYFIRAWCWGEQFSIAAYRHSESTLFWGTVDELRQYPVVPVTPPVTPIPPFHYPVVIAPFKDPEHKSGCPTSAEDIGLICETEDSLPATLALAARAHLRVVFIWDHASLPVVPPGLRPWDQFWIEAYRTQMETLDESYRRWARCLTVAQQQWSYDLGVVAQFYNQGGAPPNELWTTEETLAANALVPQLIEGAPRVKVVAPFAYDRLNGITAHPELQIRLDQYRAATPGHPHFVPIPPDPPPVQDDFRLLYSLIPRSPMKATQVISGKQLKAAGSGVAAVVKNPLDADYLGLPPKGTTLPGGPATGDVVLSINPDGGIECRAVSNIGSWETAKKSNGFLVYSAFGDPRFLIPFAE